MSKETSPVLPVVEELIEMNKESHYCYNKAAAFMQDPAYQRMLLNYAHYRKQFADELEKQAKSMVGQTAFTESILEAISKGWIDAQKVVEDQTASMPVLEECQQIDAQTLKAYQTALACPLPSSLLDTIKAQYASVQAAYKKVNSCKEIAVS